MQTLWQDLRYGARMLLKQPGFTLIAVVTLALGIGANTAIFSVVNAVLLRPLPYAEPGRLVSVWETNKKNPDGRGSVAYPNFYDWRAQSKSFEGLASYYTNSVTLTGQAGALNARMGIVSAELLALLGAKPQLGRLFTAAEGKAGNNTGHAVILSHSLWQRRFSGDPHIAGQALTLNGKSFNIVGVMPAGFQYPIEAEPVELWITSATDGETSDPKDTPMDAQRGAHFIQVVGRLKPGVKVEQAQAELDVIAANLEKQYPDTNTRAGVKVLPYHEGLVTDYSSALWLILGAVGCVLLIACANVANLSLARATARQREIAVRAALGAHRGRVIRQLLTESLLLSLTGGLLGLWLASWGTEGLIRLIPEDLPRLSEINLDRWVLGFTLLVSVLTGIIFGLAPALQASKVELTEAMKDGARTSTSGRARLRCALVVAEIAIALVVLISAGLLLQTFRKLQQVDLGYDTHNVLTATVEIPDAQYPKLAQVAGFYRSLVEQMNALPGVEQASAITPQPLSGDNFSISFEVAGRDIPKSELPNAHFRVVASDYFATMKIPVLTGRAFTEHDDAAATPVIIINEAFAQKHFPGENPLGKHLKPGIGLGEGKKWHEVVGIVKNVKHRQSLGRAYEPEYYLPHAQMPFNSMNLVIRTKGDPRTLVSALQPTVNSLDKNVPVFRIKTMEQYLGTAVAQPRFNALLLALFAGLALLLTALGLYGVMAYTVAQRTPELGLRIALGAQTGAVLKLVLRQGLALTAIGLVIGLGAAIALTRLLRSLLFGITSTDPLIFAGITLLLTLVAIAACWVPARRATKVDPMIALRNE